MQNHVIKLAPSILAADFARLGEQVAEAERSGADRIHVDVMVAGTSVFGDCRGVTTAMESLRDAVTQVAQ